MNAKVISMLAPCIQTLNRFEELCEESDINSPSQMMLNMLFPEARHTDANHYFIKQLYLAYCRQQADKDFSGGYRQQLLKAEQEEYLFKEGAALRASIQAFKQHLNSLRPILGELYERNSEVPAWKQSLSRLRGSNPTAANEAMFPHWRGLRTFVAKNDLNNPASCDALMGQINRTIEQEIFKNKSTKVYHGHLLQLRQNLVQIQEMIQALQRVKAQLAEKNASVPESKTAELQALDSKNEPQAEKRARAPSFLRQMFFPAAPKPAQSQPSNAHAEAKTERAKSPEEEDFYATMHYVQRHSF